MHKWSIDPPTLKDERQEWFILRDCEWVASASDAEIAQFIVDVLNEKEQRDHMRKQYEASLIRYTSTHTT